jgi:hypothetical protein
MSFAIEDVEPDGGKLIQCFKQHQDDVTIGCAAQLFSGTLSASDGPSASSAR